LQVFFVRPLLNLCGRLRNCFFAAAIRAGETAILRFEEEVSGATRTSILAGLVGTLLLKVRGQSSIPHTIAMVFYIRTYLSAAMKPSPTPRLSAVIHGR